jgi:hypothetical protein
VLTADDVIGTPVEANMISFRPSTKLLQTRGSLIRQLADNSRIEERLYLNGSRKVELFGFRLGCLVPLLKNLGECCAVDLDELLKFVQVVTELLEALF